ncbi:MAG: YHYH protein [Opitutaceae bacterium]|nr:YHYH protein [Opitutaceae bacterium]
MKALSLFGIPRHNRWLAMAVAVVAMAVGAPLALAHFTGEAAHDELARLAARELAAERAATVREVTVRDMTQRSGPRRVAQVRTEKRTAIDEGNGDRGAPQAAGVFSAFAPAVKVRWNDTFLFVESNGLPAHGMMTGISAWQQQVPLPQPYTGKNAWQIPLHPVVATNPVSIKGRFLRGAIALAANGIPIFNPQNNRGEVSQEIGELDGWGGHCGRADDYHYHAAPFHLQSAVGAGQPIAYALDGYPIYGLTEPDGSLPEKLDGYNGHETAALGYHYHGSTKYPYVNGGFHGVVVEKEGQVEPQPRAMGVRPASTPLRGAKITGFEGTPGKTPVTLSYSVNGEGASVNYAAAGDGGWKFRFVGTDGSTREETYRAGEGRGGGGGGGPPRDGKKQSDGGQKRKSGPPPELAEPRPGGAGDGAVTTQTYVPKRTGNFSLRSSAVSGGRVLPAEFTGDGASISPPLEWVGAPAGTKSFAVIMHHFDPEGKTKWYWTLYNIPADVSALPKDVHGVGDLGNNSVTRRVGYAPPHSKGPGEKTYILTAYALSAPLKISAQAAEVNRDVLLAAMKDFILDSAELKVVYTRPGGSGDGPPRGAPKDGKSKGKGKT